MLDERTSFWQAMTILRAGSRLFCHDERKKLFKNSSCKCRPRMAGEVCRPYEDYAMRQNSRVRQALVKAGISRSISKRRAWGWGEVPLGRFCREIISPLGYRRRSSNGCSPRSNFPRPPERYFWSTSRRNWRALMGTTKRSFAGFVIGSARTVKVSMRPKKHPAWPIKTGPMMPRTRHCAD